MTTSQFDPGRVAVHWLVVLAYSQLSSLRSSHAQSLRSLPATVPKSCEWIGRSLHHSRGLYRYRGSQAAIRLQFMTTSVIYQVSCPCDWIGWLRRRCCQSLLGWSLALLDVLYFLGFRDRSLFRGCLLRPGPARLGWVSHYSRLNRYPAGWGWRDFRSLKQLELVPLRLSFSYLLRIFLPLVIGLSHRGLHHLLESPENFIDNFLMPSGYHYQFRVDWLPLRVESANGLSSAAMVSPTYPIPQPLSSFPSALCDMRCCRFLVLYSRPDRCPPCPSRQASSGSSWPSFIFEFESSSSLSVARLWLPALFQYHYRVALLQFWCSASRC